MGKLIFGMMQSLDGYVDDAAGRLQLPPPGRGAPPPLHRSSLRFGRSFYGRRMYEVMRYWDEDPAGMGRGCARLRGGAAEKLVASRTLKSVGENATLVDGDLEVFVRRQKAEVEGDMDVAGPDLAGNLTSLGLIDEYRLYFRPFVPGARKPYFGGDRPPLRFVATDLIGRMRLG